MAENQHNQIKEDQYCLLGIKVAQLQIESMEYENQWFKCLKRDLSCVVDPSPQQGAIYISSLPTAQHLPLLQSFGINSVISAAKGVRLALIAPSLRRHLILPAEDNSSYDLSQFFDETFEFIEKARSEGNVLVHCMAGVSRSATIVAAYMIRKYSITTAQVVSRLQDRRQQICPNPGFMQQLKLLEETIQKRKFDQPSKKTSRVKTQEIDKRSSKNQKKPFSKLRIDNQAVQQEQPSNKDWKMGASTLLTKDWVKEDDSITGQPTLKDSQADEGTGERRKSRTLQKIEKMKTNMVVNMVNGKLQSSANFGKLLKSNIYRNKLKIR